MSKWANFGINPSKNIKIEHKRDYKGAPENSHEWQEVDAEYYNNFVRSIPWFNNGGPGNETCRGYSQYTYVGYVPTKIITTGYGNRIYDYFRFSLKKESEV